MVRKVLLLIAGLSLALLGLIGLVLPVLPGLLLLAAAVGCLSLASRRFRARVDAHLETHPRFQRALRRWRAASSLPPWRRLQLGFWLTLAAVLPGRGR